MAVIITADSVPDYDAWGPDNYWSCEDWIAWHKALKDKYGKATADTTWQTAWNKQDSWEHNYNWCKYGADFNAYVNAEKLSATHLLSDVIAGGTRIGGNVIGAAEGATNTVRWIIPALIIIVVIGALVYFGKKYKVFKLA
jgi:hypothetical protein